MNGQIGPLGLPALVMLLVTCLGTPPVQADEITLTIEPVCPYICADKETGKLEEPPGAVIEIAMRIFQAENHNLRYVMQPWARAVREVRAGTFDATLNWEENTPDFILPQQPVGRINGCFYVRDGYPWRYAGLQSLTQIKLGIIIGDVLPIEGFPDYAQAHKNTDLLQSTGGQRASELNIRKLLAGRIDAFFDEENLVTYLLKKNHWLPLVEKAGCPTKSKPVYMAFSPSLATSRAYAQIFSDGINALRNSGELQRILDRYHMQDWQPRSPEKHLAK